MRSFSNPLVNQSHLLRLLSHVGILFTLNYKNYKGSSKKTHKNLRGQEPILIIYITYDKVKLRTTGNASELNLVSCALLK